MSTSDYNIRLRRSFEPILYEEHNLLTFIKIALGCQVTGVEPEGKKFNQVARNMKESFKLLFYLRLIF